MLRFLTRSILLPLSFVLCTSAVAQTTVTLQQGLNSYTGAADTKIVSDAPTTNYATASLTVSHETVVAPQRGTSSLVRFDHIFQSEGGPVPNNATITSATLSVYKYSGLEATIKASRLLKNWVATQATWNVAATGTNWTSPGANGSGSDYVATADGQAFVAAAAANNCGNAPNFPAPCWLIIDVTAGVQAFAANPASNYGWKLAYVSDGDQYSNKDFNPSEQANPNQISRPKLTITYTTTAPASCGSGALRPYEGAPIDGTPIQVAAGGATWEAEHFNCGGQDTAYHDNVAGNNGSAFRATEDVDIIASTDSAGGGYVIQNFYTGEWMTYTINVAQTGVYDFAIRAAANNSSPPGAYHMEIDGVDVTGNVTVPVTGTLSDFQWITKTGITLTAGQHVLKLVSNQQFFHINQLRFTTAGCTPPTANLTVSPTSGPAPLNVTFNASASVDGSSPITSLTLNFGDGSAPVTWTNKNTTQPHTYTASSTASLTVTSECATSAPYPASVTVNGSGTFPSSKIEIPTTGPGKLGETRGTFHSMSIYWNPANAPAQNEIRVRYRRATDDPDALGFAWKYGWPLWYDNRNFNGWGDGSPHEYRTRGSVVYLTPGTEYVFELGAGTTNDEGTFTHYIVGTTRTEIPLAGPEACVDSATVTCVRASSQPLVITDGGSPGSYRIYDGWNGMSRNTINRGGAGGNSNLADKIGNPEVLADSNSAVVVKASHVIVRRLTIRGAALSNVYIHPGVEDVVIDDCEIADWSWRPHGDQIPNWGDYGTEYAAGIHLTRDNSRIVIQRNKIHDPHLGSFPWDFGHPHGPSGITIWYGGRENVIRYNEIYSEQSDNRHWVQDGIYGLENFSATGVPGADSDIYHNNIQHVFDDPIEAEGGGTNVRIWGNYTDYGATGVATTIVHFGPMYVFRNVINRIKKLHNVADPDDDTRNMAFKAYGSGQNGAGQPIWGGGRQYFFHNTLLQQTGETWGQGAAEGIVGNGMRETWSRNNILHVWRDASSPVGGSNFSAKVTEGAPAPSTNTNNIKHDLYNGRITSGLESPGVPGKPDYQVDNGWDAGPRLSYLTGGVHGEGRFQLQDSGTVSLGVNQGLALPNFSADIDNVLFARKSGAMAGGTPDIGAHDSASPDAMKFGIPAAQ